jgi:hypothetical protein
MRNETARLYGYVGNARSVEEVSMIVPDEAARSAEAENRLERARAAAREFCRHFGFPQQYLDQLKGNPIQRPLIIEKSGVPVEVFRWLGHGRGAPYVQVELDTKTDELTVYGSFNDREFGQWKP